MYHEVEYLVHHRFLLIFFEITDLHHFVFYRLRLANVEVKFVTNTTKESRRILYERLVKLGFELDINEIWSSLWAARDLIQSQKLHPMLLVDKLALEDFSCLPTTDEKRDSVVIGLAPEHFHYSTLNEAFR